MDGSNHGTTTTAVGPMDATITAIAIAIATTTSAQPPTTATTTRNVSSHDAIHSMSVQGALGIGQEETLSAAEDGRWWTHHNVKAITTTTITSIGHEQSQHA